MLYTQLIENHHEAMAATEACDPVTQNILIKQLRGPEQFLWFIRPLESNSGRLSTADATTEQAATDQPPEQAPRQPRATGARCADRALTAHRPKKASDLGSWCSGMVL
ncbi:hypothetical protein M4D73_29270 [Streptomyces pseudogriseolus]|nr:hypothetical protein [Streptomyces pseudogriseolus]